MSIHKHKIAVIGSGAVGGFYGSLLAKSGCEVSFLIHSDFENISKQGLKIESIWGDFGVLPYSKETINNDKIFNPNSINSCQAYFVNDSKNFNSNIDTILIALKSTENLSLASLLKPFESISIQKKLQIVLIQNGIGQELLIHELLPFAKVYAGLAFLCSVKKSPNCIQHMDYGDLTLAESSKEEAACGVGAELQTLGKLFQKAGIPITLEDDLVLARWKKLVWNIPFNGLSVLLNAETDRMVQNQDSLTLVRDLMAEVQLAAKAEGKLIPTSFLDDRVNKTFSMKPYPTSMKLDYENGRKMELDGIYRSVLERAQSSHTSLPNIKFLFHALEYLEKNKSTDKK